MGRKAIGTMYVLSLGPDAIPDATPIRFFRYGLPHGTAGEVRALVAKYGTPYRATFRTIDQTLVERHIVEARLHGGRTSVSCAPLTAPVALAPTTFRERNLGKPWPALTLASRGPAIYQLMSPRPFAIDVRRFGHRWVQLRHRAGEHCRGIDAARAQRPAAMAGASQRGLLDLPPMNP